MTIEHIIFIPFLVIPIGGALYLLSRARQRRRAIRATLPHISRYALRTIRRLHGELLLLCAALAALLIALANPRLPVGEYDAESFTGDTPAAASPDSIIVLLDLSLSMEATDLLPSRRQIATRALSVLFNRYPTTPFAIIGFTDHALLFTPPTSDTDYLQALLTHATPAALTSRGSNPQRALALAHQLIAAVDRASLTHYLLLISDGEFTDDAPTDLAASIAHPNTPIISVAVGTADGAILTDNRGVPLQDRYGTPILSRRHDEVLRAYSANSGGRLFTVQRPAEIAQITAFFDTALTSAASSPRSTRRYCTIVALLILLCMGAPTWIEHRRLRVMRYRTTQ